MKYQLKLHAEYLACLVSFWQPKVILIPVADKMPESWGPSEEELASIRSYEFYESTVVRGRDEQPDEDIEDDEEHSEDNALLEALEESDLIGGYSEVDEFEIL